jgi:hypothetical protein
MHGVGTAAGASPRGDGFENGPESFTTEITEATENPGYGSHCPRT